MLEIEHKYLLKPTFDPIFLKGLPCKAMCQTYFKTLDGKTLRIREVEGEYILCIKGKSSKDGLVREELETKIDKSTALYMYKGATSIGSVCKHRYYYEYEEFTYEIDEYFGDNEGLFTVEVELSSEKDKPKLPNFIGKEITSDKRYKNKKLASNPYKNWGKIG